MRDAASEGLGLDAKQKELLFQLGVVYEKQGKFDDAVGTFRRVIALDPKHAEAYNYVGYMYAEKRAEPRRSRARSSRRLSSSSPRTATSSTASAGRTTSRASTPMRCASSKRAVERAKEDPVIFEHLGDAYMKNGLDTEAVAAWEKALKLDPTADGVKKKLNDMQDRRGRTKR